MYQNFTYRPLWGQIAVMERQEPKDQEMYWKIHLLLRRREIGGYLLTGDCITTSYFPNPYATTIYSSFTLCLSQIFLTGKKKQQQKTMEGEK